MNTEKMVQSAREHGMDLGDNPVAYEFYNPSTGHAIVDYTRWTHAGHLREEDGYIAHPLEYARASLAGQAAAPEGWVMVPETPTHAMFDAFYDAPVLDEGSESDWRKSYRAMLAAAPTPPGAAPARAPVAEQMSNVLIEIERAGSAAFKGDHQGYRTAYANLKYTLLPALASAPTGAQTEGEQQGAAVAWMPKSYHDMTLQELQREQGALNAAVYAKLGGAGGITVSCATAPTTQEPK